MLEGIRKLEGFRCGEGVTEEGGEKWEILLGPPGSHRMLYTLQVVDGVLEFVDGCGGGGNGVVNGRREWEVRADGVECFVFCVFRVYLFLLSVLFCLAFR